MSKPLVACRVARIILVILALSLTLAVPASADQPPIKVGLPSFVPGQDTAVTITIPARTKRPVTYDIQIHYDGPWWGGGSGPATARFGSQYWMECFVHTSGCTEWWRGTVSSREVISIPLTTRFGFNGRYANAITIQGTINGQAVNISVAAVSHPPKSRK